MPGTNANSIPGCPQSIFARTLRPPGGAARAISICMQQDGQILQTGTWTVTRGRRDRNTLSVTGGERLLVAGSRKAQGRLRTVC